MASLLTSQFEVYIAEQTKNGGTVVFDEFIFANIPGLTEDNLKNNLRIPAENQIVHRQAVSQTGIVNTRSVVYSVTIGTEIGDFDFNFIGLINKSKNLLAVAIQTNPIKKIKNQNNIQGNSITRNVLLEFSGAQQLTGINVNANTWQIDFTLRLHGLDEKIRLTNRDLYGRAVFFDDGFLVKRVSGNNFSAEAGNAYIEGVRADLATKRTFTATLPCSVYADVVHHSTVTGAYQTTTALLTANKEDYKDSAGYQHYVQIIADIDLNGMVTDRRLLSPLLGIKPNDLTENSTSVAGKDGHGHKLPQATPTDKGITKSDGYGEKTYTPEEFGYSERDFNKIHGKSLLMSLYNNYINGFKGAISQGYSGLMETLKRKFPTGISIVQKVYENNRFILRFGSHVNGSTDPTWSKWQEPLMTDAETGLVERDIATTGTISTTGNGRTARLGTSTSDVYLFNSKNNSYLQSKDEGYPAFNDNPMLLSRQLGTTHLDTLKDQMHHGLWGNPADNTATPERGYPQRSAGSLMVMPSAYGVQQIYSTYNTKAIFKRNQAAGGGWSGWIDITPTPAEIGALATSGGAMEGAIFGKMGAVTPLNTSNSGYAFVGDNDSGVFCPRGGELQIATNGTSAIDINASQAIFRRKIIVEDNAGGTHGMAGIALINTGGGPGTAVHFDAHFHGSRTNKGGLHISDGGGGSAEVSLLYTPEGHTEQERRAVGLVLRKNGSTWTKAIETSDNAVTGGFGNGAFNSQLDTQAPYYVREQNSNGSNTYYPLIKGRFHNIHGYTQALSFGYMSNSGGNTWGSPCIHYLQDNGIYRTWFFNNDGSFRSDGDVWTGDGRNLNAASQVAVLSGIINHGGVLPIPAGYSEGQCRFMVSSRDSNMGMDKYDVQENGLGAGIRQICWLEGRTVHVYQQVLGQENGYGWKNHIGNANYIVIGVK